MSFYPLAYILGSLAVILATFWVWMLASCLQNETEDRWRWVTLMALTGCVGALLYYLYRHSQREAAPPPPGDHYS